MDRNKLITILVLCGTAFGQVSSNTPSRPRRFTEFTVSTLPAASTTTGQTFIVTDAASGGSCSSGGGSNRSWCRSNGSTYDAVGDGGGAGGGVTSIATTSPITGGTITTTGTIACATCVTSAASLTSNALVVGGGSQASAVLASLGTTTTVLHGNAAGLPSFAAVTSADLPNTVVYNNQNNTYSAGTTQAVDTITAKYWGSAPIFDASKYSGADLCAKVVNVIADSVYTAAARAIIDIRGLQGDQNCASNMFATAVPTLFWFGETHVHLTAQLFFSSLQSSTVVPAPSAPSLSSSATGGSLLTATAYGVKVTYTNINGESLPSSQATSTTPTCGGNVCSITVTAPAASFGATCYNVYSATPVGSGWKLNNTTGCVPLTQNYVIQTVGAGAVPPAASTAVEDMFEVAGAGDSTVFSLENGTAGFAIVNDQNVYVHNFKVTSSQSSTTNNAMVWIGNSTDVTVDGLSLSGGGHEIYISNSSARVNVRNIRIRPPTITGTSGIYSSTSTDLHFSNINFLPGVWPTGSSLQGGFTLNNCDRCTIDGVSAKNLDFTTIPNAGVVDIQGGTGINISRLNFDTVLNGDGVVVAGLASKVLIDHAVIRNSNATSGVGTNANNGDCFDVFTASNVTITNFVCDAITKSSQPTGQRLPGIEIYESAEVSLGDGHIINGGYYGISSFGSPGLRVSNLNASRNADAGIFFQDFTATVSCNGTTTVTWVSGQPFGPWLPNTPIIIAGTTLALASTPVSTTSLTLTSACTTGNPLTMNVYTQDIQIVNTNVDDNGKSPVGGAHTTSHCEGIYLSGHTQATITGGSGNDSTATIANKTQCYAVRMENNARGVVTMMGTGGPTGNWGTGSGGDFQDSVGTSVIQKEDNASGKTIFTPSHTSGASINIPSGTAPTTPAAGDIWQDTNEEKHVVQTATSGAIKLYDSGGTNAITHTTSGTITSYTVNHPLAAATGVLTGVNSSNVITWAHSGDAAHSISQLAKTAAVTTFTLCAATANTACGQAGQYRISYNFYGSGTACATVTAGSVGLNLTWTDTNAVTHTTISLPLWDQKSAAMTNGLFNFNTALGTEGASGSYIISTNGTIIQAATTYTACTSGTGTYNLKMTVEQLQ